MDLPFSPLAADAARSAVSAALVGVGSGDLVDEARLVGTELVTNAFQSGSPPLMLAVDWVTRPQGVTDVEITVTDGGCKPGHRSEHRAQAALPNYDAEDGRGLFLVQALTADWSLDIGPDASRAWCLLRTVADAEGTAQ
ncbi:hypothetical protein GCM10022245_59470 [Streptomyces mayteni]